MIWLIQLVFDCDDPDSVMQFWGRSLGHRNPLIGASPAEIASFREEFPQFEGRGRIDDEELRRMPVYIQRVPEQKLDRNRVRLEVASPTPAADIGRMIALGARRTSHPDEFLDIEGNEFVVVESEGGEVALRSVVIDAIDPERLLEFWSAATGYRPDRHDLRCAPSDIDVTWNGHRFEVQGQQFRHICGAGAPSGPAPFDLVPGIEFAPTDRPKELKNRLHVDLNSTDAEADRERLVELGATAIRWDTDHVLQDPEGNEFCLSGTPAAPT